MGPLASQRRSVNAIEHVLVLGKKGQHSTSAALFGEDCDLVITESFDAALEKLRSDSFDLIVIENDEFLSLERGAVAEQSSVILETVGQAVAIMDLTGRILWGNRRLDELPDAVASEVKKRCVELFAEEISTGRATGTSRRFSVQSPDGAYFEVTASPVVDGDDHFLQIAVVLWDVTSSRQLQQKIDAIDKAGRELVRLESDAVEKLNIPGRLSLLEEKIIRYTREVLGFDKFSIRLLDKKSNRLELVLSSGIGEGAKRADIFALPEGNGICGYVAATGRSYICPDVTKDRRYADGIENAASSLTVPLFLQDSVVGIFNIESETLGAFSEDDRQFAEIFGRYVAIALHILDLLVIERYNATGQLADSVASQISGPLNDILADATALMEEYIGRDDLRGRLQSICDSVGRVRGALKNVTRGANGLLDHDRLETTKDELLQGRRILVIDDEPIIRETITTVLGSKGAEVETAREGDEAMAMLAGREYDLILSDIKMPQKNGYEIFAAAKDADPDRPVIFMTGFGYDPNHSIIRARQEGLSGVLYKPFKVSEFLSLIKDVLREAKKDD